MAILDTYNLRFNTTNNLLEMNLGAQDWEPVPLVVAPGEIAIPSSQILVGNGSGLAQARALSGDATLSNTGVLTLAVTPFPAVGGTLHGNLIVTPASNSTATFQVNQTNGTTHVLTVDTTNQFVSVGVPQTDADFGVRKASGTAGSETIMQVKEASSTSNAGLQCFNDTNAGIHIISVGSANSTAELRNKGIILSPSTGMRLSSSGSGQVIDFSFGGVVQANVLWSMLPPGILALPPITTTARDTVTPVEGYMCYNVTLHKMQIYTGAAWETLTSA